MTMAKVQASQTKSHKHRGRRANPAKGVQKD